MKKSDPSILPAVLFILGVVLLIIMAVLSGCTDINHADKLLKANGFKNISYTGYDFFACSEDDFYHTGFIATTASGTPVKGTVCKGAFFKGATIRFD